MLTDGFIKLRAPLACKFAKQHVGKVVGLNNQALLIAFVRGAKKSFAASANKGNLQLFLSADAKSLQLPVQLEASKDRPFCTANVMTLKGKTQLHELVTAMRKDDHIDLCTQGDVEASDRYTGFNQYSFMPKALPNMQLADVDTNQDFLGLTFALPLLITGMTGGVKKGELINHRLAEAAQAFKIPMGVGSQRIALENPTLSKIFTVRKKFPDIFLIANLGLAQLREKNFLQLAEQAVEMIEANALALHVNVLQELIQIEGDKDFRYLVDKIAQLVQTLKVPVIVKEVGSGLDTDSIAELLDCGVAAIDVGGRGGTAWGFIEGQRANASATQSLGKQFRDWGIPTANALVDAHDQFSAATLIATGGIRDGQMVAKAVALGATMVGIGLPLLKAALNSREELWETLELFKRGLMITMMCTESRNLHALKNKLLFKPYPGRR